MPSSNQQQQSTTSAASESANHDEASESPSQLILSTPAPLLTLMTQASPMIHAVDTAVRLVTWTYPSYFASFIVIFVWWFFCLYGVYFLKYGINGAFLAYGLYVYLQHLRGKKPSSSSYNATLTPASYMALLEASARVSSAFKAFRKNAIPPFLDSFSPQGQLFSTARLLLTSYPLYLAITYFFPLSQILLILGSIGILWNAPFFSFLRTTLWKSAIIRWLARFFLNALQGDFTSNARLYPLQPVTHDPLATMTDKASSTNLESGNYSLQVLFTIFENQRWWVGIDWTHALLPGERPSWTDPLLNPTNPPAFFTLPAPKITYTSNDDGKTYTKTSSTWKWVDKEWRIMPSHKGGIQTSASIKIKPGEARGVEGSTTKGPSPVDSDGSDPKSPTLSSELANAGTTEVSPPTELKHFAENENIFNDWSVDIEGWQYGDNQFSKLSPKGGLGKYTRRRAWVRRAGLVEATDTVTKDEMVVEQATVAALLASSKKANEIKSAASVSSPTNEVATGEVSGAISNSLGSSIGSPNRLSLSNWTDHLQNSIKTGLSNAITVAAPEPPNSPRSATSFLSAKAMSPAKSTNKSRPEDGEESGPAGDVNGEAL